VYVAADFHQHSILSADAPVSTRDRVLANAAEAVEVAVASEHNLVADLLPIVRELGMSRYVVSLAGNELTTDASQKPCGGYFDCLGRRSRTSWRSCARAIPSPPSPPPIPTASSARSRASRGRTCA